MNLGPDTVHDEEAEHEPKEVSPTELLKIMQFCIKERPLATFLIFLLDPRSFASSQEKCAENPSTNTCKGN